jgi:hypothetical protein
VAQIAEKWLAMEKGAPNQEQETDSMNQFIRFLCSHCRARIKAPLQLVGRKRDCPGCSQAFIVPCILPDNAGPVLVPVEEEDRFTLGVIYPYGEVPVRTRTVYPARQGPFSRCGAAEASWRLPRQKPRQILDRQAENLGKIERGPECPSLLFAGVAKNLAIFWHDGNGFRSY